MNQTGEYLMASSTRPGALGIVHLYGEESMLADRLDRRLMRRKSGGAPGGVLAGRELRYGWLADAEGEAIDEVMLAKPADNFRILMTHGGAMVRRAVVAFLRNQGFSEISDWAANAERLGKIDSLLDPLLASAITETQAAAILSAREREAAGSDPELLESIVLTHRLVLAGPPNVGKSSLLNRLAGYDRAFVHHEPGATLDVVDELVDLGGYAVVMGDLPGFRQHTDELEKEAWRLASRRVGLAEGVLFVCDGSVAWDEQADRAAAAIAALIKESGTERTVMIVVNKSDLPAAFRDAPWERHFPGAPAVRVCALPDGDAAERLGEMAGVFFA